MNSETVYLSLGSNMGDSLDYLLQAILALQKQGLKIQAISSIYRTEAVGYMAQPDFLNLVLYGETVLSAIEMLEVCLNIEKELGRVRTVHWGPRVIDLDLLFFGQHKIKTEKLQIPHPRLHERAFVLIPLREINREFFTQLNLEIPPQKVDLLFTADDVKLMLNKVG
jgi:2-amino-4-hydroxy-6-hydroxymethyldihydropteridine diphosphokinase